MLHVDLLTTYFPTYEHVIICVKCFHKAYTWIDLYKDLTQMEFPGNKNAMTKWKTMEWMYFFIP